MSDLQWVFAFSAIYGLTVLSTFWHMGFFNMDRSKEASMFDESLP